MFFFLSVLSVIIGKEELDHLTHIMKYKSLFELPYKSLCWEQNGVYKYSPMVDKFMEEFKESLLYDHNHLKTLRPFYPKPFDNISKMKYVELKAVLTMMIEGESVREGCFCKCIKKGQVAKAMNYISEFATSNTKKHEL